LEKILVIQTAFTGDAILTLPMLQKLREIYPESIIDVVSNPANEIIFSSSPSVNEVIILDKRNKHKSVFSVIEFAKKLKERGYTKLYSPHRSSRTSLIVLFSDISNSYGFENSSLRHVYKHLVHYDYNAHEVQRNLNLIGYKYDDLSWKIKPELNIDLHIKENVDKFINENNPDKGIIAIAPGSIWGTKQYPVAYTKQIISAFKDFRILLIGGEKDIRICEELLSDNDHVISAAGKFSLPESIELLKNVNLLVCNDSAPTHMGMCANIPVLTLYCSTSFKFGFYPYNERSSYLSYDDLTCKPCGIHGYNNCPINTFDCGMKLVPEIVIEKMRQMLNA